MSIGDGRDGKMRAAMAKGQLGGKLAGLSLPRQIITIALWPLLEQVMSFICTSTSLILATGMSNDGAVKEQLASGIGVTGYILWLGFLMQGAVGMGATAIVSRRTGARRFSEANYSANQAALLGLLAGLLSSLLMYVTADFLVTDLLDLSAYAREVALRYMKWGCWVAVFSGIIFAVNAALRGSGDTRTPFFIMLAVDGLNVVLSIIFVHVCGMSVEGLALGMVTGMIISAGILIFLLARHTPKMRQILRNTTLEAYAESRSATYVPPLYLDHRSMKPDWGMMGRILGIGLPQAVEVGGIWLIQIYVLHVISRLGDAAIGAHTIAIRIESLSFLPSFAIGIAGASLVGQYLGSGSVRLAMATIRKCIIYSMIFTGTMGCIFFLFPEFFVRIFASDSPGLMAVAVPVVKVFLLAEPFYAGMLMIKMCLRGAGDTRRVMYVSYSCMGFVRVICLMLWNNFSPESLTLTGIWFLIVADLAIEYIILEFMLHDLTWARRKV